ncbi:MAG: hypothetical protein Ct9H90mP15_02680 [Candidatus Neomarinimicrobiota bacterium]|nr:MAG: hypothetical protein Ct9H90mP15_02680 [Candidatus Neomarinimicrobiota bacterium]
MFGNMKEMLKQAQNMKAQMDKVKKELEQIEVEGSASNGACVVKMTADMKVTVFHLTKRFLVAIKT